MSAFLFGKAFKLKVGNSCRKLVLLKLADNCNDQGECWPSYQHIADQCEMSRRSVITHINKLSEMGFVEVCSRSTSKGSSSNKYRLNLPSENIAPLVNADSKGGEMVSPPPSEADSPLEVTGVEGGEIGSPPSENDSLPSATVSPPSEIVSPGGGEMVSPRTYHSLEPTNEPVDDGVVIESVPEQHSASDNSVSEHPVFLSDLDLVPAADLKNQRRFPMHFQWMPTAAFKDRCRGAGVLLTELSQEEQDNCLGEFRSYWEGRADQNTQSLWEHKLMNQVKRLLISKANNPAGELNPAQTRANVSASVMDVNNTDW